MKNTVSLAVVNGIIEALGDTLNQNKRQGILSVPIFSGITQASIAKTQGRTFGGLMQNADCHQFISRLSTRRDEAKLESGLTRLMNERDAGERWLDEARLMLEQIREKNVQSFPVFSDVQSEGEVEISFAALDPEQIVSLEQKISAGSEMLKKMSLNVKKLTEETRVEITAHEQKKLKTLIPGFEHTFPMAVSLG